MLGTFVSACALAASDGEPHLYAIAGQPLDDWSSIFPNETFPVLLYRVENGGLTKMRTIATRRQNAIDIRVHPENGFAFIVSRGARRDSFLVDILDLRTMAREYSVDFDVCAGCWFYSESHLLQRDDRLIYYIRASGDENDRSLGLDMASGEFLDDIDRGDATYAQVVGSPPGFVDGSEVVGGIYVRKDAPDQPYLMRNPDTFDLDWKLPSWFSMQRGGRLNQMANNHDVRVLLDSGGTTARWLVLDKEADRWSSVPSSTFPLGRVRVFRHWLVQEEYVRAKLDESPLDVAVLDTYRIEPFLSAAERFRIAERAPTGRLLFYDIRAGTLAELDTGDPDSEILLIDEHDTAYFRVGDELRCADIQDGSLANESLLADAPELFAVHWLVRGFE